MSDWERPSRCKKDSIEELPEFVTINLETNHKLEGVAASAQRESPATIVGAGGTASMSERGSVAFFTLSTHASSSKAMSWVQAASFPAACAVAVDIDAMRPSRMLRDARSPFVKQMTRGDRRDVLNRQRRGLRQDTGSRPQQLKKSQNDPWHSKRSKKIQKIFQGQVYAKWDSWNILRRVVMTMAAEKIKLVATTSLDEERAAQMDAVHLAIMNMAGQLAEASTLQQQDLIANEFAKLARTYVAQIEALKRYRGGGERRSPAPDSIVSESGQVIVDNASPRTTNANRRKKSAAAAPNRMESDRKTMQLLETPSAVESAG
jgi:hypothetical protein